MPDDNYPDNNNFWKEIMNNIQNSQQPNSTNGNQSDEKNFDQQSTDNNENWQATYQKISGCTHPQSVFPNNHSHQQQSSLNALDNDTNSHINSNEALKKANKKPRTTSNRHFKGQTPIENCFNMINSIDKKCATIIQASQTTFNTINSNYKNLDSRLQLMNADLKKLYDAFQKREEDFNSLKPSSKSNKRGPNERGNSDEPSFKKPKSDDLNT